MKVPSCYSYNHVNDRRGGRSYQRREKHWKTGTQPNWGSLWKVLSSETRVIYGSIRFFFQKTPHAGFYHLGCQAATQFPKLSVENNTDAVLVLNLFTHFFLKWLWGSLLKRKYNSLIWTRIENIKNICLNSLLVLVLSLILTPWSLENLKDLFV